MRQLKIYGLAVLMLIFVGCSNLTTTTSTDIRTTTNTTKLETTTMVPVTTTEAPTTTEQIITTTIAPTTIPVTTTSLSITEPITTTEQQIPDIAFVNGVINQEVIVDHYFDPLLNVYAESSFGKDITSLIRVIGSIDYGTVGEYQLTYQLNYYDDSYSNTITVSVVEGDYVSLTGSRPTGFNGMVVLETGSYLTGSTSLLLHPVNPGFIRANLLNEAIPSSGWWTSLLVGNYGYGNGIYLNPLRAAFSNAGMEITNPLDGFVQYWNNDGYQTIAQFPIGLKDTFLRSTDLNPGYVTEVIDHSDSHVRIAMKNSLGGEDEVVVTMVQGSPYVFVETANKNSLTYTMDLGVLIEYYNLEGNKITTSSYNGDAIIVKMVQRHSGYDNSPPANIGQPEYTDKFYLVNAPQNTTFNIASNVLSMNFGDGNYISIVAINDLTEAEFYHNHGYTMITDTSITYEIDYEKSLVYTDYVFSSQTLRTDVSIEPLLALMPHHYKYSDVTLTNYSYRTVRGTLKVMAGNNFQTVLAFNGLLPGFTLPENTGFSAVQTTAYLEDLDAQTDIDDPDNFLNDEGPYWNSKALYPLAQGLIIADQLNEEELKQSFILKLRYLLTDWYTYNGSLDEKFLYYNNAWGSVYYSNDDFGTATSLSDHSFTHGYLIYASAVLAMYDDSFKDNYGLMVELLLDDYMYPYKDSAEFAYLRNFDQWAGHSWAHGFGTFAEGNNLESTSEALNSWNAGYLWSLANNDTDRMEAAIYGFVTEISAIKEYWFDYDEENWDPDFGDYVDVAGMVWGGKHDYATWFGANPTFIYGIQWLPTGEYLTNYALNDGDYTKFSSIYATYLAAKNGTIDTWYSNMWAIQAIIDPQTALNQFDANLILTDDYPAELVGTYWMINALESLGRRNTEVWMGLEMGVSSTVYEDEIGNIYAMVWNGSDEQKTVNFFNSEGLVSSQQVDPHTFVKVNIE